MPRACDRSPEKIKAEFALIFTIKSRANGWRQMVGAIPGDDELSRSAGKLGRDWRKQANKDYLGIDAGKATWLSVNELQARLMSR